MTAPSFRLPQFSMGFVVLLGTSMPAMSQWRDDCPPIVLPAPCPPSQLIESPKLLPAAPTPAPTTEVQPAQPDTQQPQAEPIQISDSGLLGAESRFAAMASSTTSLPIGRGGYIDNAIPTNMLRFRYDAGFDFQNPVRATFFYPAFLPFDNGPSQDDRVIDYQEASVYGEVKFGNRFSGFIEAPWRWIDSDVLLDSNGISDINGGIKAVLFNNPCETFFLTGMVRLYGPTGDVPQGLGTGHYSIEPGFLTYLQVGEKTAIEGELRYWIPLEDNPITSDVIRYGIGVNTELLSGCNWDLRGSLEVVAWTVLDGALPVPGTQDLVSASTTIVNVKPGARLSFGKCRNQSVYVGYGRAITGTAWYEDIVRAEYRLTF